MNIILLAPPAAGKGTQSKMLVDKYNLKHISTGDLLREAINKNDETSKYINEEINAGRLVNDDIILNLIKNKLNESSSKNGVVLDGFPRNLVQAQKYDELLQSLEQKIDYVLYLDIDKDIAAKRIAGRLSCPNCGKVYNEFIEFQKPIVANSCDSCGFGLTKREDDNEETYIKRYNTYLNETSPLIKYYEDKNVLYNVDSNGTPSDVFGRIERILDGEL